MQQHKKDIPEYKNIMKTIAERICGELDQEFRIVGKDYIYKITKENFLMMNPEEKKEIREFHPMPHEEVMSLLTGEYDIVKKEFVPKLGEQFWSYNNNWGIIHYQLNAIDLNFLIRLQSGLIFRTRIEAIEKRQGLYYELTGSQMETDGKGNLIIAKNKDKSQSEKEKKQKQEQQVLTTQIMEGKEFYLEGREGLYKLIGRDLYVCHPTEENPDADFKKTDEPIPAAILTGKVKKKRLRFIPKPGDKFYSYNDNWEVTLYHIKKPDINFFCRLKTGIIFETYHEASAFKNLYHKRFTGKISISDTDSNMPA